MSQFAQKMLQHVVERRVNRIDIWQCKRAQSEIDLVRYIAGISLPVDYDDEALKSLVKEAQK